jgi:hypothetical protein
VSPSPTLRNQWTIKSKRIDQELVNGCRMAAERQGMAMGDWCIEILREGVRNTLTGSGDERPTNAAPPARLEDVADALTARMAEAFTTLAQQQNERMEAMEQRMAETVEKLVHQPVHQPSQVEVHQGGVPADDREARRMRVALRRGHGARRR